MKNCPDCVAEATRRVARTQVRRAFAVSGPFGQQQELIVAATGIGLP